jgi:mono/diheme cytochrome c family protein
MGRAVVLILIVPVAAILISASLPQRPPEQSTAAPKGDVARGKYLVEEVAKCAECHTPRDERGGLKSAAWLRGAPIWIRPVAPIANWADSAPPLAGLPSLTDAQAETVLQKGTGPEGEQLRPPMHTYHMNRTDAKAIIAYLKSLPRGPAER